MVLIDDVVTSGATLAGCARALYEAGAAAVSALTAGARALIVGRRPLTARPQTVDARLAGHEALIDEVAPQRRRIRVAHGEQLVDFLLRVLPLALEDGFRQVAQHRQPLRVLGRDAKQPLTVEEGTQRAALLGARPSWTCRRLARLARLLLRHAVQLSADLAEAPQPQRVVDVWRPGRRLDQPSLTQPLQVVDDRARRQGKRSGELLDRHPPALGQQPDDAQSRRVGQRLEGDRSSESMPQG